MPEINVSCPRKHITDIGIENLSTGIDDGV